MNILDETIEKIDSMISERTIDELNLIAALSMCRTKQIIVKLAESVYLNDIKCLNEYIEKNMLQYKKIQKEISISEVEFFLSESGEILENMEYDDNDILYLAYDLCEGWYNYTQILNCGIGEEDRQNVSYYVTLPLQLLVNFVSDQFCTSIQNQQDLDEAIRKDIRITNEIRRILQDFDCEINENRYSEISQKYAELDILMF